MFLAHLPAGYLLTRGLQKTAKGSRWLWVGLVASVLPDIDLLYFYTFGQRQTVHHHYFTHVPVFWLTAFVICLVGVGLMRRRDWWFVTLIFFANIFLHLVLDTFVGGIAWLYPFYDQSFVVVTIPATHDFWVWNFVFHWSFMAEITICVVAIATWIREKSVVRKATVT